ncbi:hypothetical protein Vi05172_g4412 [Venturia inaequalis]|nr:hypothetical protein Vi05172_g4412 [Venturia inaequalis]
MTHRAPPFYSGNNFKSKTSLFGRLEGVRALPVQQLECPAFFIETLHPACKGAVPTSFTKHSRLDDQALKVPL